MKKQDITAARTAEDLKRQYDFERNFSEIMGVAMEARTFAEKANETASKPAESLTPDEVFNILTNNGEEQGVYREDGKIYINASYIKTGSFLADLIKTGVIVSADGKTYFDLNSGTIRCVCDGVGYVEVKNGFVSLFSNDGRKTLDIANYGFGSSINFYNLNGETSAMIMGADNDLYLQLGEIYATLSWKDNGDGTYSLIGTKGW